MELNNSEEIISDDISVREYRNHNEERGMVSFRTEMTHTISSGLNRE